MLSPRPFTAPVPELPARGACPGRVPVRLRCAGDRATAPTRRGRAQALAEHGPAHAAPLPDVPPAAAWVTPGDSLSGWFA